MTIHCYRILVHKLVFLGIRFFHAWKGNEKNMWRNIYVVVISCSYSIRMCSENFVLMFEIGADWGRWFEKIFHIFGVF